MDGLQQALLSALSTILIALIGVATKKVVEFLNQKGLTEQLHAKREIVKIGVQATEQLWKHLGGNEKLEKAKRDILRELNLNGLKITDDELNLFIESAIQEMQRNRIVIGETKETGLSDGFEQLKLDID